MAVAIGFAAGAITAVDGDALAEASVMAGAEGGRGGGAEEPVRYNPSENVCVPVPFVSAAGVAVDEERVGGGTTTGVGSTAARATGTFEAAKVGVGTGAEGTALAMAVNGVVVFKDAYSLWLSTLCL